MALTVLAIIYVVYRLLKEFLEPEIPAGYHNNWRLESQDRSKVICGEMTQKEFLKNMRDGKYR